MRKKKKIEKRITQKRVNNKEITKAIEEKKKII
jgi:hypothetical protein